MKSERKQFSAGKRFRFLLEAGVLWTLAGLVPLFPRRTVVRAGRALGALAYALATELREVSRQNLDVAFGESKSPEEKRRIARASMANTVGTVLGLFWAPRLTRERLDALVDLDTAAVERVREIHARGKGSIFITVHLGDWELLGLATSYYGFPMTVVQEAMRNEHLEGIFGRLRGASGNRLVPNRFAATTLFKTLRRGGSIALLNDLNATRKRGGAWLEFFGLPAFSNTAAGALALHTGAAIVGARTFPLPDGRVRIWYEPIEYADGENAEAINQRCLAWCERVIRENPECWMWSYRRWSPRATEAQGRYPAYSRYRADVAP